MNGAELKEWLAAGGAREAIKAVAALEDRLSLALLEIEKVEERTKIVSERLAKAMEREADVKEKAGQFAAESQRLDKENKQLRELLARYDAHPEVRAAKHAALMKQAVTLFDQAQAFLVQPEPAPNPSGE